MRTHKNQTGLANLYNRIDEVLRGVVGGTLYRNLLLSIDEPDRRYVEGVNDVYESVQAVLDGAYVGPVYDPVAGEVLTFLRYWERIADYKDSGNPAYAKIGIRDVLKDLEERIEKLD